jgi:WD40 repeat protein
MSRTRTASLSGVGLLALLAMPGPAQPPTPQGNPPPRPAPRVDHLGDPLPPGAVARLGTTRFRQGGAIQFVGYSGDGRMLLAASADQTLRFWDARTGKELRRLPVKASSVMRYPFRLGPPAVLSGDGKTLALELDTGECSLVDVPTGKAVRKFKTAPEQDKNKFVGGEEPHFALSHNGSTLMALHRFRQNSPSLRLWDTATGKLVRELSPKDANNPFTAAALSRDGTAVLLAEGLNPDRKFAPQPNPKGGKPKEPEAQFRLLNVATGNTIRSFAAPVGTTTVLQFAPDGKTVVVGSQDGSVRLLEAATGKERTRLTGKPGQVLDAFFSPAGGRLFVVGQSDVTLWDLRTGKEIRRFSLGAVQNQNPFGGGRPDRMPVPITALSPDGRTLALPEQATVTLWDVETGKRLPVTEGHRDRLDSVAFAPKGGSVLTGSGDSTLAVWDVRTGKRRLELTQKTPDAAPAAPRGMEQFDTFRTRGAFSPDGKTIAGLWWNGRVHLWDAATGKLRHHLGEAGYTAFAFAPDGKTVAANGQGGAVVLWDPATGKEVRQFPWMPKEVPMDPNLRAEGGVYTVSFSADGRVLLGGAMLIERQGLRVLVDGWERASGGKRLAIENRISFLDGPGRLDEIARALDSFIVAFLFSPDERLLAEVGFSTIKLRDLRTGKDVRVLGGREVRAPTAVFSPDGKLMLAGQRDGTVRLWDVATGDVLLDFPTQQGPITALCFSADGKLLATGSTDTTAVLWDWEYVSAQAKAPPAKAGPGKGKALLEDLGSKDAARAYKAMQALIATPAEAVALLKPLLRPLPAVKEAAVRKLLDDLESKQVAVRDKAEKALADLGSVPVVREGLQKRLAGKPAEDTRQRLTRLLERLDSFTISPEMLKKLRAIEVLELVGTPAARKVLESVAGGAAGHRLTDEAQAAVRRLKKAAGP